MKKRLLCVLVTLCLLLCLPAAPAFAEDGALLRAGDHIYLGEYTDASGFGDPLTSPVCWRILDPSAMNTGEPGVFLLSQYVVQRADVQYDEEFADWEGSLAQQWCTDFAAAAFTEAERALIPAVSKTEEPLHGYALSWRPADLEQEQVFFLSARECKDYIGPEGSPGISARTVDGVGVYWWFRSPHFSHPDWSGLALQGGDIHDSLVYNKWGARPATNLDPSRALLLIPAQGQRSPGEFAAVSRPEDGNWKLIVPDESRTLTLDGVSLDGACVKLSYSGAATGEDEYLSLLARDAEGRDLFWGRLCRCEQAAGELTLELDSLPLPEGAALFLFSEHEGGDLKSNYASPLCPVACRLTLEPGAGSGEAQSLEVLPGSEIALPDCGFTAPRGQVFDHWELDGAPLDAAQPQRFARDAVLTAVYRDIPVSEIRLGAQPLRLKMFERAQLAPTLLPEDAAETALHWQSSNPLVLHVDQNGALRGLFPGTALLTVSAEGGDASAELPVSVSASRLPLLVLPLLLILAAVWLLTGKRRRGTKSG